MNYFQQTSHFIREKELSLKRLHILGSNLYRFYKKDPFAGILPSLIFIEPTNVCNLKCPLCPTGNSSLSREKGFMSAGCLTKIVDEIGDYALHISLWNYGEPLCHNGIFDMIGCIRKKNIFVRLSTNGALLGIKEARKLVTSGLDHLIVCLDGASQQTLSVYRIGSDFGRIIRGVQAVSAEKRRVGTMLPFIELQFIVMQHNEHEIGRIKEIARDINADAVRIKTVSLQIEQSKGEEEKIARYLPKRKTYSRYDADTHALRIKKKIRNRCLRLWLSAVINFNGDVVPCCNDPDGIYIFGNIMHSSLKEIWNGREYIEFRKKVLHDKKAVQLCKNCTGTFRGKSVKG